MLGEYAYMMTVIMPSYNCGQYIAGAIQSVLEQERNFSLQIIITDDASTDDSISIIKAYEEKYPDIICGVFADENEGLFDNYYKAVEKLNSKYFCVLDPDDYYTDKRRLQKAVDFLETHEEYTIYAANAAAIREKTGEIIKKYYEKMPLGEIHTSTLEDFVEGKAFLCNTPGSTFRNVVYSPELISYIKELCQKSFYDKAAFRADLGRNLIHLTQGKAYFVNEYVAEYRIHDHNLFQNTPNMERFLMSANMYIIYDKFLSGKFQMKFYKRIYDFYKYAIINYYNELCEGDILLRLNDSMKKLFVDVFNWLELNKQYFLQDLANCYNTSLLPDLANRKIFIWGTGAAALRLLDEYHITLKEKDCFVNTNLKSGETSTFCEKKVYSPKDVVLDSKCYIVICSSFYLDILKYIEENNFCDKDIIINLYAYDKNYGQFLN